MKIEDSKELVVGVAAGNEDFLQALKDQFSNENEGMREVLKKLVREAVEDMLKEAGGAAELMDIDVSYTKGGILEGKSVVVIAYGRRNG